MSRAAARPLDESAVIVPALELDPVVEEFRQRHDPSARAGVPPHVTLMYPFLEPDGLTSQALLELDTLLADVHAFEYSLIDVREFGGGVLYLAPAPAEPFISLTQRVGRAFDLAPYGGAHAAVVPHLTITQTATAFERLEIARALRRVLPQPAIALEAWVMAGSNDTAWTRLKTISFRR